MESGKPYSSYPAELHENPTSLINTPARTNEPSPSLKGPQGNLGPTHRLSLGIPRIKEKGNSPSGKPLSTNILTSTTTEPTHKI